MGKHLKPSPPDGEEPSSGAPLWLRRTLLFVGLLLLGCGSAMAGFAIFTHQNPIAAIANTFIPTPMQVFGKPNILVLVEGIDYDYTANDIEYSADSRSDIIKAVNLDFADKNVYVLNVLRDMLATYPNGTQQKINAAQSIGGPTFAEKVIASFLGIPGFDKYVVLRIDATKDLINAIGGVDVYVKTSDCLMNHTGCTGGRIDYDDNWGHLHIHLTEGWHHLNGDQAVSYSRFRHDWCSDPCRVMRQDDVITAAIDKLKGDKLNTLLHARDIMAVVKKDVQTNLTQNEMISLASYFSGLSKKDIHFNTTPYTGDEELADGDDLIPDQPGIAHLAKTMLIDPPTPEPSPDAMALAAIAPSSVRVEVENASGVNGAAAKVAAVLKKDGFVIAGVGNAASDDAATTMIQEHSNLSFAGAKVRAALPPAFAQAQVVSQPPAPSASPTSDVTVIVGRDLANAVVANE